MVYVAKNTIYTDEARIYQGLSKEYKHKTVNHGIGEYVRIDESRVSFKIHTNTIEGCWSLLKKGVNGIYHHISEKHIDKYADMFCFRYNSRTLRDSEGICFLLGSTNGRLKYKIDS